MQCRTELLRADRTFNAAEEVADGYQYLYLPDGAALENYVFDRVRFIGYVLPVDYFPDLDSLVFLGPSLNF